MDEKIIATFCLCDDLLKAIELSLKQLNDAEVLTIALVAASCSRDDTTRLASCSRNPPAGSAKAASTDACIDSKVATVRLLGAPVENPGCRRRLRY